MRALVIGGTGFAGAHLVRLCLEAGDTVYATGRSGAGQRLEALSGKVELLALDVRDEAQALAAVREARPDRVYHLAGLSSSVRSFAQEEEVLRTNLLGLLHVLRSVKAEAKDARVLYVGSAEEYGRVDPAKQPLREDAPLRPVTPYGVSRASASLLALRFALAEGLHVVRTRSFNHTGPGQSTEYVCASFAEQLVRARARGELSTRVLTGDLSVRRDFSGVRGVARAYRALLEKGEPGEVYNVCSGRADPLSSILERIGEMAGVKPLAERDPARARPADMTLLLGDATKLERTTGLSLASSLDEDLRALVSEMQERLIRP